MTNKFDVGDIWRWTKNSADHPDDPNYNYFMILDKDWGYKVLYLIDGQVTTYTNETFEINKKYLEKIA